MIQRQKYKTLSRSQVFSISVLMTFALVGIANFDVTQRDTSVRSSSVQQLLDWPELTPQRHSFQSSGLVEPLSEVSAAAFDPSSITPDQVTTVRQHKPTGEKSYYRSAAYRRP